MHNAIEFTDREQFVLSYYRDSRLSSWRRFAFLQGTWLIISAFFLILAFRQRDYAWALVSYGLLLWLGCSSIWRARQYSTTFRGIITKYDAKLKELTTPET
ncbi:MAG: hypothetical protein ACR2MW_02000 [Chthoniobacterales bacterium]